MTPAQKEILLVVAEWWKMYGYGPSIDDVMRMTGEKSRGNVNRKMWTVETEEHVVTTYELPMLIDILQETGFHSIRIVDHESLMPPDHDCVRWLLSARK